MFILHCSTNSSIWRDGYAYQLAATATVKVTAGDKEWFSGHLGSRGRTSPLGQACPLHQVGGWSL